MRLPAFACAVGAALVLAAVVSLGSAGEAPSGTIMREPSGPALTAAERWSLDLIRLPAAWDVTTGATPGPLIAVVDTGVHATSDLAGRVESESLVGGTPGSDPVGHGTEVTGIVAASGADGTGLAGVCWSCRILSLQVSTDGHVSADDIAKAVDRAVARGASVINLSLGADLHTNAERDAIKRAVAAGVVVVASAGNDGSLLPKFPAAYAGVLAVGAAGPDGKVADFSNRGSWVGVLAPACGAALDVNGAVDDEFCGTSAAAPFVSGLAGLLKSVAPNARGQDIIAAIQTSARKREGSAHGLVSAPAALAAIKQIKPGSTGTTKGALLHIVKRPLISGVGAIGARLTTSTGVFSGNLTGIQIRWQRCSLAGTSCKTVSRGSAYLVVRADRGKTLRVVARATGEDGIPVDALSRLLRVRR
jgi:Subtilase family